MDSAFHQLCPRYSGTLTPHCPLRLLGYGKPLPFYALIFNVILFIFRELMEEQFQQSMHHHHHQTYATGPPMMSHGHHDYRNDIDMSNKMIDDMRMNMPMTMVKSEPPIHPHYLCAPQIDHSHRLHYPVSPV